MKLQIAKNRLKEETDAGHSKVAEIMTRNVELTAPDETVQDAARKMRLRDGGFLPICDGQRLVGTLSDRDIAVRAAAEGLDPKATRVRDLATAKVVWCFEDEDIRKAARKMQSEQVRRLMVISRKNKQLVGVLSLGDLATNGTQEVSGEVLQSISTRSD